MDARPLGGHETKGNVEQEWVCSYRTGFKLVVVPKVACQCNPASPRAFSPRLSNECAQVRCLSE